MIVFFYFFYFLIENVFFELFFLLEIFLPFLGIFESGPKPSYKKPKSEVV